MEILLTFLSVLRRLNRDYNPLIHQREDAAFNKDFNEAVLTKDFDEDVFRKDFELPEEDKITEFKNILFLMAALTIFTVLAFYQWKKNSRFSVFRPNQDINQIHSSPKDYKICRNEIPENLLKELLRLHSLLSDLPKQNHYKSWLYSFLSIWPDNLISKLPKIEPSCSGKPFQTRNLSSKKYWNEVERGLRESLNSLKTMIDPTSTCLNSIDRADKGVQVNEELVFQLLKDGFKVEETAIKPFPEQANVIDNIVLCEHQPIESVANNRTVPLKQVTYLANRNSSKMPSIDAANSSLDGNILNIEIEFDRRVRIGKLTK